MDARQTAAFTDFATRNAPLMHRTAYLLVGDWHTAQDLVQETLARAFVAWRRIQAADAPEAYLRRMLINQARQTWRHQTARPEKLVAAAPEQAVADSDTAWDDRDALLKALASLPLRQRATVVFRFLDGLSVNETADAMNCSTGTIKSQTSKALRALQLHIQTSEGLEPCSS